uniref:Kinesin-like protein n=1 Tax=Callorhinchus milii TaxID=7868 RepID=A0A4W3J8X8_CALMI|eukprot:gi/632947726/ref/XP_007889193.1/ PREDICTED: kinesin-like protein KIF20A [Callorhinchus milii]
MDIKYSACEHSILSDSIFYEPQMQPQSLSELVDEFCTPKSKADNQKKQCLTEPEDQCMKVYLRVRPFSQVEMENNESQDCVILESSETVVLRAPKLSSTMKNSERGIGQSVHKFTFTQIFGHQTTQKQFFDGTIKNLVKQFLKGQNSLVFTYGVTNAGKTYTIQGTPKDGGILPRSLDMLFNHVKGRWYKRMDLKPFTCNEVLKLDSNQVWQEELVKASVLSMLKEEVEYRTLRTTCQSSLKGLFSTSTTPEAYSLSPDKLERESEIENGFNSDTDLCDQGPVKYSVWVSFCEIYNEYVYDLLEAIPALKTQKRRNLRVCEDQNGNCYVKELKWIHVTSADEANKVLKVGNKNRSLACTKLNQQSSRSHTIFSVRLMQMNDEDNAQVLRISELSLCDLAGSERCGKTQTFGNRLKEAGNINNSLLILGKCIAGLRERQHNKMKAIIVPFRESKLTRLFQGFFCDKGKACMIININQCASTYDETLHVMKFSGIAKQIVQIIQPKLELINPTTRKEDSMMVCMDLSNTLATENSISGDLLHEADEEELDVTALGYEEMLDTIENLKQKLIAERQHKLLLEIRVREEMGQAMFQQLMHTEEVWSERFEELKENYDDQLESKLHMYKESIKRHAYKCALEEIKDKHGAEETFTIQGKVKEPDSKLLEESLNDCQSQLAYVNSQSPTGLTKELEQLKEEVLKTKSQMTNLQLEVAVNCQEVNKYKELYEAKAVSEEWFEKLSHENDQLIDSLKREIQDMHSALQEAEENYQEANKNVKELQSTLAKQDQMLADIEKERADQINELQATVVKLQEELALRKSLDITEKPPKKRFFTNLAGSKLSGCSSVKYSLFKSKKPS